MIVNMDPVSHGGDRCAKLSKWNRNSLKTEQVRFGLPFGSDLGGSLAFLLLGGGRNQLRP